MKRILVACLGLLFLGHVNAQPPHTFKLSNPDSWSMVIIPDPQSYVKFNRNQPILDLMMQWVKDNADHLNVGLVLCTGDLVEQNNIFEGDGVNGNMSSIQQWEAAARSFAILDTVVPYIVCTGNHDHGVKSSENRYSQLNSYFPPQKNPMTQAMLRGMIPNAEGVNTLENAYYEFVSPHGEKFLVMSLEFNPRQAVVDSAKQIVARAEYKDHKVLYLTHSYLESNNNRIVKEGYPLKDVTHGEALWQQLIRPASNSAMVVCGHIGSPDSFRSHVGYRVDENAAGKRVHQMVFNAQALGGGWHGNGGDGWLRVLEFLPDGKTVLVKTFSPLFDISPSTRGQAFSTEAYNQFEMKW